MFPEAPASAHSLQLSAYLITLHAVARLLHKGLELRYFDRRDGFVVHFDAGGGRIATGATAIAVDRGSNSSCSYGVGGTGAGGRSATNFER